LVPAVGELLSRHYLRLPFSSHVEVAQEMEVIKMAPAQPPTPLLQQPIDLAPVIRTS
jgi:hypothetical protein